MGVGKLLSENRRILLLKSCSSVPPIHFLAFVLSDAKIVGAQHSFFFFFRAEFPIPAVFAHFMYPVYLSQPCNVISSFHALNSFIILVYFMRLFCSIISFILSSQIFH